MHKPNMLRLSVYREERFRVPSQTERELGLWVDRIGEGVNSTQLDRLRILGQFCHIVVLEGEGLYSSRRFGTHTVRTGDCMVQCPDDPCAYWPHGQWRTRWITWNGPESRVLMKLGYIVREHPVFHDRGNAISQAYKQLKPIMQRGDKTGALNRKIVTSQMVLALHDAQRTVAEAALGHPRMEEALQSMHAHFNEDVPISRIAQTVGLSPTHFRRLFRSYTGRSPREYITALRIVEAKRLLREGLPIKAVAIEVGYADTFYFMRVFKKVVGRPPGNYAKRANTWGSGIRPIAPA